MKSSVNVTLLCAHTIKVRLPPFPNQKLMCPHGCGYQLEWEKYTKGNRISMNPKVKKWTEG